MKVTDLDGKDVYGLSILGTLVVAGSMFLGHVMTTRSCIPSVVVQPSAALVNVQVPTGPTPVVNVAPSTAAVTVQVPTTPAPAVHVTTPPATVTVINQDTEKKEAKPAVVPTPISSEPKTTGMSEDHSKAELEQTLASPTIVDLYKYADAFVNHYCEKHGLDALVESRKWTIAWEKRLADSSEGDEQAFINRVCIEKRGDFSVDSASQEQILEGCRLLLRYRDASLQPPKQMLAKATPENLRKTITFLAFDLK